MCVCLVSLTTDEPLQVRRLLMDDVDRKYMNQANSATEKELAILFSDIRSFTTFSERHLPHDIVHILNRYFLEMGTAVHNHQGRIDKYMGDGIIPSLDSREKNTRRYWHTTQRLRCCKDWKDSTNTCKESTMKPFKLALGSIMAL